MGLLEEINKIDTEMVSNSVEPFSKLFHETQYSQWRKGLVVLKYHAELEGLLEAPLKGGRPAKDAEKIVSFTSVAQVTGRNKETIRRWVSMVKNIGKEKAEFEEWFADALQAAYDKHTTKLIATDVGPSKEDKQKQKQAFNAVMNAIRSRVRGQEPTPEDAKWLVDQVVMFVDENKRLEKYHVDEHYDRALELIRKTLAKVTE